MEPLSYTYLKFNGRREGEGVHMYLKQLRLVILLPLAKSK